MIWSVQNQDLCERSPLPPHVSVTAGHTINDRGRLSHHLFSPVTGQCEHKMTLSHNKEQTHSQIQVESSCGLDI